MLRKLDKVIRRSVGVAAMQADQWQPRIMVAAGEEPRCRELGELLGQQGQPVPSGLMAPLSLAADRASRSHPDMLVLALEGDRDSALAAVRQTRSSCTAYIVAIGPADDGQFILRCLHEGADEFLDVRRLSDDLPGALLRFCAKRRLDRNTVVHGKVISVIGASGGAGASTIAANVAGLLANKHQSCGLFDLRLEAGDLAALLSLAPQHTLAEFCANAGRVDRNVLDQMFTRHASGLELLAAPWDPRQASVVTPQSLRLLLAMSRPKFPYLVLDLDNRLDDLHVEALWQSDLILFVTRLDFLSVRSARRLLDRLLEMGIEPERIQVVANRYKQPRELSRAHAETALGTKISHFVVDDAGRVNFSANEGKLVSLQSRWSTISRNLKDLAISVNGRQP